MNTPNQSLPRGAWLLGLAGLIPIVVPLVFMLLGKPQFAGIQRTYAACILAFLGGMHWGPALYMGHRRPLVLLLWGVCPCLFAVVALQLPGFIQPIVLAAGFIVVMVVDLLLSPRHPWAKGYLALRTTLTAGVVLCLIAAHFLQV